MNGQIVYIVPSQQLVIVRTGLRPPAGRPEWDNSVLPNLVLRALQRIAANAETRGKVKFGQIFLAAPDVDRDLFLDLARLYQKVPSSSWRGP